MKRYFAVLLSILLFTTSLAYAQSDAESQDESLLPGQIAYIGADYNVYTTAGESPVQLTDDATELQRYQWPTWSTNGRLAYFHSSLLGGGDIQMEAFVAEDGTEPGELVYSAENEFFNYAFWSPQDCASGDLCRDLAILLSSETARGLFVQRVRSDVDGVVESETIGRGGPFYYSWSPDGTRMLWQRNNQRMDIYDANTGEVIDTLTQQPGLFQAPMWSPVDDRLLFGERGETRRTTNLVIVANDEPQILAEALEGPLAFAWSPDGNYVAYTVNQGPLFVVDAISGEMVARSTVNGVLAFFWSPNSESLAYITVASPPDTFNARDNSVGVLAGPLLQNNPGIAWSIIDIADSEVRQYGAFVPTQEMLYLLIYFDQFSQSHRIWSPDSQHLVYSETTTDGRQMINLIDTTNASSVPISIAEGLVGIWSFE